MYIRGRNMQVAKWGNSLGVRLPSAVVKALELKAGDQIDIRVVGPRTLDIERKPDRPELIRRLRKYRGMIPADFKFDRSEIYERD
jgi:antitoxin MazE